MAKSIKPLEATVVELQSGLNAELYDSVHVVQVYLDQINKYNERLRAVIQTAPPELLLARAQALDQERKQGKIRGPLHGIPVLVKVIFHLVCRPC